MKTVVVVLLVLHGAIHGMGVASAFGWGGLPDLSRPVSRREAVGWGLALALLLGAAGLRMVDQSSWWWVAALGLFGSQAMLFTAWSAVRYGTLVNVLLALPVVHGFLSMGPTSDRALYDAVVRDHVAQLEVGR